MERQPYQDATDFHVSFWTFENQLHPALLFLLLRSCTFKYMTDGSEGLLVLLVPYIPVQNIFVGVCRYIYIAILNILYFQSSARQSISKDISTSCFQLKCWNDKLRQTFEPFCL